MVELEVQTGEQGKMEEKKKLIEKSYVVPKQPSRLRDR